MLFYFYFLTLLNVSGISKKNLSIDKPKIVKNKNFNFIKFS